MNHGSRNNQALRAASLPVQRAIGVTHSRRVIAYTADLLPYSETFIRDQLLALRRWIPVLAGCRRLPYGLSPAPLDSQIINPEGRIHRLGLRLSSRFHLAYPPALARLKNLRGDLVHVHFGTQAVDIWPCISALGLPMLVTLHGYDVRINEEWWASGKGGWFRKNYLADLRRLSVAPNVRFIAVSSSIRARAIELGIDERKISLHHIGVDVERFAPGNKPVELRENRILFVGRLVEKKGLTLLIEALPTLSSRIPDVQLVIAGDGPLRPSLEDQARRSGVPVHFLGATDSAAIRDEMHRAKLLCAPSITASNGDAEGLPMVILEAQASGLPVVTSALGGKDEGIVDGESGLAFAENQGSELVEAISRILTDGAMCRRFASNARKHVLAKFDLRECTAALEDMYDQMIGISGATSNP